MSKQDAIKEVIDGLRTDIPEIKSVIVASTDGLPIAASISNGVDVNRVAAMAITAVNMSKRISSTLSMGGLSESSVTGVEGQAFFYSTGENGVLAVTTASGANLGLIHLEARTAARKIAEMLS